MFNNHDDKKSDNTSMDHVASDISNDTSDNQQHMGGIGSNPIGFNDPITQPQDDPSDDGSSATAPVAMPDDTSSSTPATPSNPKDLDDIKNKALQQLSPLVGKLEQSPEERYKTIMMMIQASDNHDLIKDAYEAANSIQDEQLKAEALLGVVNEINYFTQQKKD